MLLISSAQKEDDNLITGIDGILPPMNAHRLVTTFYLETLVKNSFASEGTRDSNPNAYFQIVQMQHPKLQP